LLSKPAVAYALPVVLVLAAALVRPLVGNHLGGDPALVLGLPVVVLSAWVGGFGPGLLAVMLHMGLRAWMQVRSGALPADDNLLRVAIVFPSALLVCVAFEQARRARLRAERDAGEAQDALEHAQAVAEAERRAQARMQRLVDSSAVAIAFSRDGVVREANDAFLTLFGYSRQELAAGAIGAATLVPPDEQGVYLMARQELQETGRNGPFHAQLVRRDGIRIDVITSAGRLDDNDYCIFFTDITALTRAEEALRASQDRFRSLVTATASIVWTAGPKREYVSAQPSWAEYTGQTPEEYMGYGWINAMHPDDRPAIVAAWKDACQVQRPFRGRARMWHAATQTYRRVAARAQPVVRDGEIVEWVGMVFDVEEGELTSERLQEASQRLQLLLENTPLAVVEFDGELRITRWAGQAPSLFGWEADETLGRPAADFGWPGTDDSSAHQTLRRLLDGDLSRARLSLQSRRKNGGTIYGEWSISAVRRPGEQKADALLALVLDATEREAALQTLRHADRQKDNFIATLAHELRNPLAPIANGARLLLLKPDDPKTVQWSAQAIERQVRQLTRLLDDLLDVSRISRNRLQLQRRRMNLQDAVEMAAEQVRPFFEAQGHHLALQLPEAPVDVMGDQARLVQVFANLLHNAAKYTPQPGTIELRLRREGDETVVQVQDPGVGLSREDQLRVFEMFSQAHPELRSAQPGLGIGLALVRGIVDIHGGRVAVASDGPGHGSCFTVTLPALREAEAGIGLRLEGNPAARLSGYKVLVVDDNVDSALSIGALLSECGNVVETATGVRAALELGHRFHPSVVLMDIGMPDIDGWEGARMMRATPWGRAAVLVAMTGFGQPEDRRRSAQAGFDHHLTKPLDFEQLQQRLTLAD
jgi:PAS domain S-box-containing protein